MNEGFKKIVMVRLAMILSLGPSATTLHSLESAKPADRDSGDQSWTMRVDGLERRCVVHLPARRNGTALLPAVMVFHGGGGTARGVMRETGFAAKADEEGFIAVFPEGTRPDPSRRARFRGNPQTWNDGSDRDIVGATQRHVDDVRFVSALIDDLISRFGADSNRIYATGFSNGASMVFRLGRELSTRLAAVAPVSGSDWSDAPEVEQPISILYITGTADPLNPIDGGDMRLGRRVIGQKPPVDVQIRKWVKMLGCPSRPQVIVDEDGIKKSSFAPCRDGSEVVMISVQGMGHAWPGGMSSLPKFLVGETSDKLDANDVIWNFFKKHPRR